ncbi:MAG: hypothetical protein AAF937_05315 [Planctomycetota bacterium]
MPAFESGQLIDGVHWWELAGHHDPAAFVDAWRQAHFACQAVAEAGKSWADQQDDDSHSSLVWVPDRSKLPDQYFAGTLLSGDSDARALLRPWDLKLFIVDAAGSPLDLTDAQGRSVEDLKAWVRATCEQHVGTPKQDASPAPDLPDHPLGQGASFAEPNQLAMAEVIRFYANADAVLQRLAELLRADGSLAIDDPKVWPHHFDLAMLVTIEADSDGDMTKTIGVGLTPPDSLSTTGYWYISPWSRDGHDDATDLEDLSVGTWHSRDGALPMAVLSVDDVTSTEDPAEQHRRVASFVSEAYTVLERSLRSA